MKSIATPVEEKRAHERLVRGARRRLMTPTPPMSPGDPFSMEASECGGACVTIRFNFPPPSNGGCGAPTVLSGTNGGEFECGAMINVFGDRRPHYCPRCQDAKGLDQFDKPLSKKDG
jgi:hypothetical protein